MSLPDELGRTLLSRDFKVVVGEMLIEARGKTRRKRSLTKSKNKMSPTEIGEVKASWLPKWTEKPVNIRVQQKFTSVRGKDSWSWGRVTRSNSTRAIKISGKEDEARQSKTHHQPCQEEERQREGQKHNSRRNGRHVPSLGKENRIKMQEAGTVKCLGSPLQDTPLSTPSSNC